MSLFLIIFLILWSIVGSVAILYLAETKPEFVSKIDNAIFWKKYICLIISGPVICTLYLLCWICEKIETHLKRLLEKIGKKISEWLDN